MKIPPEVQARIGRLRDQINDLRYRYHVLNDPQVTDAMYDPLMEELRALEATYPELIMPDSPTQRVAGKPLEGFEKIVHQVPQWSFNDAFDEQDIRDWEERILKMLGKSLGARPQDISYVCELKIDGLHMVLTYEKGLLVSAATRGDGKIGENVTANVRTIQSVPLRLTEPLTLVVEGEVWLARTMLETINEERKRDQEPLFANPRNAAAGTIRQLDPAIVARRKLVLTAYDISQGDVPPLQSEELECLKTLGFKTDSHWRVCHSVVDIVAFYKQWETKKTGEPFWIDGVVIKVNQRRYQDALGYTGKAPRWAIAFKFPAEQGTTKIKEIYWQVGRTGALTPVALMEPVKLAGTTVTHATLHNFDEIERLDVRLGDSVVVEKAGDIIPKVIRVLDKLRTGAEKKIKPPERCPVCSQQVETRKSPGEEEASVALYCLNQSCYAQERERIVHFVGKHAFDIDGCGEKIVEQFLNEGLIKDAADIFALKIGDLLPLERFAEKSAEKLVAAIAKAKTISLARFLVALSIPHVGEETAEDVARHFSTLERLRAATIDDLYEVYGIGEKVAQSLRHYFSESKSTEFIDKLLKQGISIIPQIPEHMSQPGPLAKKTFVLTGTLTSFTREEAKERIKSLGGDVVESVSKKTSYVVVGENPGSKRAKAEGLGIKILSEVEFKELLES